MFSGTYQLQTSILRGLMWIIICDYQALMDMITFEFKTTNRTDRIKWRL